MAAEHITKIDKMIKSFGDKICKTAKEQQMDINEEISRLRKLFEGEEKSMLYNVTVRQEENKVIEQYWVMRAIKETQIAVGKTKQVFKEQKCKYEPTLNEIAQFLYDSKADFVSVVKNYRFEKEGWIARNSE